jgi:radical SAM superfamily enzyme YgiQ (UPF0313 family)
MGTMENKGHILLINPWIYDFAAHNLWIEPLGLLTLAAALRENGYSVSVIDCLAPYLGTPSPRVDGSGKFLKAIVDKPEPVLNVPRYYGRYGLPTGLFDAMLASTPAPDAVLVTSGMSYWYPGVVEAIRRVRGAFGSVPVALGGVYATLCPQHARQYSGADRVIVGPGVVEGLRFVDLVTGNDSLAERYDHVRAWPPPAHRLVPRPYAGLVTSWGCPYRCTYCASHRLQPTYVRREPGAVVEEIAQCVQQGIRNFAFYDDALLIQADTHLAPILEGVLGLDRPVAFYTPNGIHAGEIDADVAVLMRNAGFATIRLSLETIDAERQWATGGKVTTADFERAAANLRAAGYKPRDLGAYILAGLPGQPLTDAEATVRFVHDQGVQAKLALFSPIPGTPDGDLALWPGADPLLHNNTVYPYLRGGTYADELQCLKLLAKEGNAKLQES